MLSGTLDHMSAPDNAAVALGEEPTIGNLIRELQKYDPDFVITYASDEPPPDVDDIVALITRPQSE